MPYYYTDHNKFYNPYAMFAYAARYTPNTPPKFHVFDEEFSKLDWSKEPEESMETLLDRRAMQLRLKFHKLVLYYSGGTDSTTMYNAFKRTGVHLDEIVIIYDDDKSIGYPAENVQWLLNNHYDPTTKITVHDGHKVHDFFKTLPIDYLVDPSVVFVTNPYGGSAGYRAQQFGGKYIFDPGVAHIVGAEKPHLLYENGHWYARHLDRVYHPFMGEGICEMFFVSPDLPELHIKQNHMFKKAAKQFINLGTRWDNTDHIRDTPEIYTLMTQWSGRDPEITSGASYTQKIHLKNNPIDIAGILKGAKTDLSENPGFTRYLDGFKMLQTDQTIKDYLMRMHSFAPNQSIDRYHGIFSKSYYLGT